MEIQLISAKQVTNYKVARFFGHFLNLNFCQCVCSTKHNGMMVLIGIIGEIFWQKKKSRPGSDRQECRRPIPLLKSLEHLSKCIREIDEELPSRAWKGMLRCCWPSWTSKEPWKTYVCTRPLKLVNIGTSFDNICMDPLDMVGDRRKKSITYLLFHSKNIYVLSI